MVYGCGPPRLLSEAQEVMAVRPGRLRTEAFRAADVDARASHSFTAVLHRAGKTLSVASDASLLSVLEEAGVGVVSSCREGTCGTCESRVLGGHVDHRDSILSEEERGHADIMYPCVSRAAGSELVLDL